MDDNNYVLCQKKDKIAKFTLNRPEKLNPLGIEMIKALFAALEEADKDNAVSIMVIRGAGRAFSAGHNLDPNEPYMDPDKPIFEQREALKFIHLCWPKILFEISKPVIAQVHGYCLAGAFALASCCDTTVVAEDAVIGMPTGPMGLAAGGAMGMMSSIGQKKMREIIYKLGSSIDGKEAERIGWANRAVPPDKLEDEVDKMANEFANTPREVLILEKEAMNRNLDVLGYPQMFRANTEIDVIERLTEPVREYFKIVRAKKRG